MNQQMRSIQKPGRIHRGILVSMSTALCLAFAAPVGAQSIAREWNEALLDAIRGDRAIVGRPPENVLELV